MTAPLAATRSGLDAEALHRGALVAWRGGRLGEALELLLQATRLNAANPLYLRHLGQVFFEMARHNEAASAFALAARLDPRDAQSWHLLGIAQYHAGRWDDAALASLEAVERDPGNAEAYQNLGLALAARRDFDKAAEILSEAVRLAPYSFSAWYNYGNQLLATNRFTEAAAAFRRAIALEPARAEPHINLALALLTQGDFPAGWREFEWRWQGEALRGSVRRTPTPRWDGSSAARRVLLHLEQGLGDTLQFCRYAPLVAARGHTVVLEVQPELTTLLSYSLGSRSISVTARASDYPGALGLPDCDATAPLMSLPGIFGTTLATVPGAPYLRAEPDKVAAWRRRLGRLPPGKLRVGLVWAGNPQNNAAVVDAWRSIALAELAPLFSIDDIAFVSLQKGDAARQLDGAPAGACFDAGPEVADFSETAALVDNLDLVVSVDTAVAHLAGGLGRPVWMLSRFNGCWRWLADRNDSPWYPTMRLFRQRADRSWRPVIDEVRAALVHRAGDRERRATS